MQGRPNCAVVLLSYRRPELTQKAAEQVLKWEGLERLYVSIDGLRAYADAQESSWWLETRAVAGRLESQDCRVVLNLRGENSGLTRHVIQVLEMAFSTYENVILLEEDVEIESAGLAFLQGALESSHGPQASSAFTRSVHRGGKTGTYRSTFFPELWGMALNRDFFGRFKEIWVSKEVNESNLTSSMQMAFPNLSQRRLKHAVRWWVRLFKEALMHPTHQDAVFALTALDLGVPWKSPWSSFARDGAAGDIRSLHPRGPEDFWEYAHTPKIVDGFCSLCEREHGRLKLSRLSRRAYEALYQVIRGSNRVEE